MGEHDLFQKIGFIGLGLIGGSIAKKIHTLYPDVTIIATAGHQETITEAYGEHLISNQNLCEIKDFYDCDYIFLCTPVKRNIEYLRQLKGNIKNGCIITDVGSVKTDIHEEVTALAMEDCFIGGHPMAGSEKTGLKNANEYLLENAYYILTPTTKTSPQISTMPDWITPPKTSANNAGKQEKAVSWSPPMHSVWVSTNRMYGLSSTWICPIP